jgi:4-hydroxybenzoyl-CoA thioesterase
MSDPSPSGSFEKEILIRFSHCDPAGIVFFPQYMVMFNGHVEDWFNDCLGVGYANFLSERRFGLPVVKLDCEFKAPSRMGERLMLSLHVTRLGRSSLSLALGIYTGRGIRVQSNQVLVTTSLDTNRAVSIPDDLRERIERFISPQS